MGTGTAHFLCKLSHFITAGDRSNNIFQERGGGGIVSEQFVKISLNHEEQYSSVKSLVYIHTYIYIYIYIYVALLKCLTKYYLEPYISKL